MLKIIADENIHLVKEAFSNLGELMMLPTHEIRAENIIDADVLLVRSVTKVGPGLLAGSNVQFVATASIGFDHVDLEYLKNEGIGFASAPGSNANSVAEYLLSAICVLSERRRFQVSEKTVGIIGCGHVGSKVRGKLQALGVSCLVNDPALKEQTSDSRLVEMEEILSTDIITLHLPLERKGRYPTHHMVDEIFLARMKKGSILINTARGAVIDEGALLKALDHGSISVVLDVWQNEPQIDSSLLAKVELGTPHIAGYSYDGKIKGTEMIYQSTCRFFGLVPTWTADAYLDADSARTLRYSESMSETEFTKKAVLSAYDVRKDDTALRRILQVPRYQRGDFFESLRKRYPIRREFGVTELKIPKEHRKLVGQMKTIGFRVV